MRREILEQITIVEEGLSGECPNSGNCNYLKSFGSRVDVEDISDIHSSYCSDDHLNCPFSEVE